MYYNHHIVIKNIGFKPIHYTINLDVTYFLEFLTNLIMCFLWMYCYFESIKLLFFEINVQTNILLSYHQNNSQ